LGVVMNGRIPPATGFLSRAGLLDGCNHYLTHGAEVDQHVASLLFDHERARELLRAGRKARLISFGAPFDDAASAANPHGFLRPDEMPPLLCRLFEVWAFSLSHPDFSVARQCDAVALRFPGPIFPDQLKIEDIPDDQLFVRPYLG
jgi:hypothetical protein